VEKKMKRKLHYGCGEKNKGRKKIASGMQCTVKLNR